MKKNIQLTRILPVTWLFSSILFFFIATIAGPAFWPQMDKADQAPDLSASNWLLGIAGIIVYFSEPLIWHFHLLPVFENRDSGDSDDETSPTSVLRSILSTLASIIFTIVILLPAMVLSLFKPVFRALILYTSLSYFGSMRDDTPLYKFFAVVVTVDILLYYLDMLAPEWKYNPVNMLVKRMRFQNKSLTGFLANSLLVIHTALIYTLLLGVVWYDISLHPEKLKLEKLALWWLILTIYTRLSFISGEDNQQVPLKNLSITIVLITIITLAISFISFIWPFYFS